MLYFWLTQNAYDTIVITHKGDFIVARLPVPGSDKDTWGTVLNDFLSVQHNADGTHSISGVEMTANKGQANGYASLDGSAKVPLALIPSIPESQVAGLTATLNDKVATGTLVVNVKDYGATGNATRLHGVTATSAGTTVTASGGAFVSGDVGKKIVVYTEDGAGTIRTISAVVSGTQVTLSGAAGITVSGAAGYLYYGTDDTAAISAALTAATPTGVDATVGPNQPVGAGLSRVLLPTQDDDTGYLVTSQLIVPGGVNLDGAGMIVNMITDRFQPVVLFNPYSAAENLLIECLFSAGIQVGTGTTDQAHVYMGNIRLWHVGYDAEVGGAQRSQDAVTLMGYHFEIRNLFVKGGVRAVYHNPGTDAIINYGYAIGSYTAVHINQGNQIAYPHLFLDTCGKSGGGTNGVIIDNQAANVSMNIQAFQVAGTDHVLDSVVAVGAINSGVNKDISLTIQANNTGGTILLMSYAQELAARIIGSNAPLLSGATLPITTGVIYGAGNTGINHIDAMLETSIAANAGTVQGTYQYDQLDVSHFANSITVAGTVQATNVMTAPNLPSTDIYNGDAITAGEEIMPRRDAIGASALAASGTLHLSYFTARKTEAATNIRMLSDGTAATGTTLARMGVYSVDGAGNLTLLAATANDVAVFSGAYTPYQRVLTSTFNKVKGVRYAVGVLVVGAGMPTITGATCAGADAGLPPRLCGIVAGQANLPASITAGSIAEDYRIFQTTITP
jgi:hypothetical protein